MRSWKRWVPAVGLGMGCGVAAYMLYDPAVRLVSQLKEKLKKRKDRPKYTTAADGTVGTGYDVSVFDEYEVLAGAYSTKEDSPTEGYTIDTISLDEFMNQDESKRHICTYFREDGVLAGMDDDLEMLDIKEVFGDGGEEVLSTAELDDIYILREDDGEAFEVVMSSENYDTAYLEYKAIQDSIGYIQEE